MDLQHDSNVRLQSLHDPSRLKPIEPGDSDRDNTERHECGDVHLRRDTSRKRHVDVHEPAEPPHLTRRLWPDPIGPGDVETSDPWKSCFHLLRGFPHGSLGPSMMLSCQFTSVCTTSPNPRLPNEWRLLWAGAWSVASSSIVAALTKLNPWLGSLLALAFKSGLTQLTRSCTLSTPSSTDSTCSPAPQIGRTTQTDERPKTS